MRSSGVVLAIDFGHRRIGLASGHQITGTAQPLKTITHNGNPYPGISKVFSEWNPGQVVVGLPLSASGEETDMSRAVRAFVDELSDQHPGIEIVYQDERFSSQQADAQFKQARQEGRARRRHAENLDSHAAAVILETWFMNAPRSN